MKAACPLWRQVVLRERTWPLRDSWKQFAFEAQYYVFYIQAYIRSLVVSLSCYGEGIEE
jgi:hypothetical protein